MTEAWKHIPGAAPGFEVSDMGRVRGPKGLIRPFTHPNGRFYPKVTIICDEGRRRIVQVHQIVLKAFVGPRPRGHLALLADGVKTDCSLANLRWGTSAENVADRAGRVDITVDGGVTKMGAEKIGKRETVILSKLKDGSTLCCELDPTEEGQRNGCRRWFLEPGGASVGPVTATAETRLLDRQLADAANSLALASGSPDIAKSLYEARPA